jgi:hypothetical protein
MKQIWHHLNGISRIEPITETAWRVVEDQSRSSTRKMVDSTAEHELLEKLIEDSKPKFIYQKSEQAFEGLHYLLSTPFRYPPLRRGSRFGQRHERNLFYASLALETALCEKAFHRLNFLLASAGNIGGKSVNCTAFNINVSTKGGIDLCKKPFVDFRERISSPLSYNDSQALGAAMRSDGIEAFISYSARSKKNGKNLNIFTPKALGQNKLLEKTFQIFSCYSTKNSVEFYTTPHPMNAPIVFHAEFFYVNGQFPMVM